jgi:hypothetical protein
MLSLCSAYLTFTSLNFTISEYFDFNQLAILLRIPEVPCSNLSPEACNEGFLSVSPQYSQGSAEKELLIRQLSFRSFEIHHSRTVSAWKRNSEIPVYFLKKQGYTCIP